MTRQPWNQAPTRKDGRPRCEGFSKHLDGQFKGQPSDERCKRSALTGSRFCKTHGKEVNELS